MSTTARTSRPSQNGNPEHRDESQITNDASDLIALNLPYVVEFTIEGVCPIIFHRWSNEAVEAKGRAKKGSAEKKTDDVESYVYRDDDGFVCLPGAYIHASLSSKKDGAAKFFRDPRSSRKSAIDLYKAGAVPLTLLAPITNAAGKKARTWDLLDARRMVVNQASITRQRPTFNAGWKATFEFQVTLPEYIGHQDLLAVLNLAGRAVGTADSRPTYGRFQVTHYAVKNT